MARRQSEIFFGSSVEAFATLTAYPDLPDLDVAPGFTQDELSAAFPFVREFGGAAQGFLRPTRRDVDALDHLTAKAAETTARALDAARAHAPELRAQAQELGSRAVAGAGDAALKAGQAVRNPKVKNALIAAGAVAAVAGALWIVVPPAISAVRTGVFQGVVSGVATVVANLIAGTPPRPVEPEPEQVPAAQPITVSGPAEAVDGGTVIIGDRIIFLAGIEAVDHPGATQGFQNYLAQVGALHCSLASEDAEEGECFNARNVNVAEASVLSGMATARPGAPDFIRNAEREARQNRAGIWSLR